MMGLLRVVFPDAVIGKVWRGNNIVYTINDSTVSGPTVYALTRHLQGGPEWD